MRLFVALHFSPEGREILLQAIASLRAQSSGGNFTRPENLHLTLAFIGETNNLSGAKMALDSVAFTPFSLTIGGSGRFGDLYWAGIEREPQLTALANKVRSTLLKNGFAIDKKPFKPHITLARRVPPVAGEQKIIIPRCTMPVQHIELMKSERIAGKPVYTELHRVP